MLRLLRILLVTLFETLAARVSHGRLLPSWSFRFEWMVRFLRRDFGETADWPTPELRADLDARRYPSHWASKVPRRVSSLAGVPIVTFTPPNAASDKILLFLHGGGYAYGSPRTTHADLLARLALEAGVEVVAPEYRLAPEHPYPAALEDTLAVFGALAGANPGRRLLVAGDSAGGNLALALMLALRDRGQAGPAAAVLVSPWLDLAATRASCRDNERYDYGMTSFLLRQAREFAGRFPLADPRLSPIHAVLEGLPPLYLQVGGAERLRDECLEFAERARRANVSVELDLVPQMPHLAPVFADAHPSARGATERMAAYVRAH